MNMIEIGQEQGNFIGFKRLRDSKQNDEINSKI